MEILKEIKIIIVEGFKGLYEKIKKIIKDMAEYKEKENVDSNN